METRTTIVYEKTDPPESVAEKLKPVASLCCGYVGHDMSGKWFALIDDANQDVVYDISGFSSFPDAKSWLQKAGLLSEHIFETEW